MQKTLISLTVLALCVAALGGCSAGVAGTPALEAAADTPVPVEIAYPERADLFATYDTTATIASEGDAPVIARVPGDLVEIYAEEGEAVEAGQVLARLDGERLRLEMLAAKADLDRARGEYERYLDLNRRGLVSEAMFEGLRYDLDALQASWELAKLNYEYSKVRAPIAGHVSERSVKLGQHIAANQELFRITETSQLIAYLQIPQTELGKFSAGHTATVSVDSMPNRRFPAEILRISPTIDRQNGTFRATAFIDNDSGLLAPGMFARFSIAYERHADVLTLPVSALVEEDEATAVYVVRDGAVSLRQISTGIESRGRIEVLDGLGADEPVVIGGHSALREGSKVLARSETTDRFTG